MAIKLTVCVADRKVENPEILASNNRIKGDQDGDSINDYVFDTAGNTTRDAQNRRFTYDAENKQIKVETVDGNGDPIATIGEYVYDGDGRRIKKIVLNGESVIFVYDASGKLIAEYANQISQTPEVSYLTNDHLGSPRINTDADGNINARHDYHPFGEEIIGTGGRTQGLNYTADDVRKQFTGYERDNESELDYAINRYYNRSHGRFTAIDPYNIIIEMEKGGDAEKKQKIFTNYISQPQIWNKYVYSINNPINYSDPDGRRPLTQAEQDQLKQFRELGYAYSVERMNSDDPNLRWTAAQAEAFRQRLMRTGTLLAMTRRVVFCGHIRNMIGRVGSLERSIPMVLIHPR